MMTPPRASSPAFRLVGLCTALFWATPGRGQPTPAAAPDAPAAAPDGADAPAGSDAPAATPEAAEADAPPADPEALEAEGKKAMLARDCETAAARFDAFAEAVKDDPAMTERLLYARLYAGVCYERLERLPEAADRLREVVFGDAPPDARDKAEPLLQSIEPLLPVQVTFDCEEPDITISLLDAEEEPRPCDEPWMLPEGNYRVTASAPDGREVLVSVQVQAGIPEQVVVLLPGAKRKLATTEPPPPPPRNDRTLEWILTGGAAAALGTGIAFNIVARNAVDRGDAAYGRYERARAVGDVGGAAAARVEVEDARDDADTAAYTSYAFLGVGAVLTGLATWLWLDDGQPAPAAALQIVPGPDGIGVVGRW